MAILCFLGVAWSPSHAASVPYTNENPVSSDPLTASLVAGFGEAQLGEKAVLSVYVAEAEKGIVYVQINADRAMKPASLMKLVTTAAVLEILGPERRFETTVETRDAVTKGVLAGDLVVRGGGDPGLGPRFQGDRENVTGLLEEWATKLHKAGIRRIDGNVVGDDTRYADDPLGPGWEQIDLAQWYSAEVSALNYNENTIDIVWEADRTTGERASYKLVPSSSYIKLQSSVRSGVAGMEKPRLRYFRFRESNDVRARGALPPKSQKYDFIAVHDPAKYTAQLLIDSLKKKGISVTGGALNRRILGEDSETSEPVVLIRHESPSIAEMLPTMIGISHNLYAEVLFRELALTSGREGSFKGGTEAVEAWLREHRLQRSGAVQVDGSGLSPLNRATGTMLGEVLRYLYNSPHRKLMLDSLATPGARSLKNRMDSSEFEPLRDGLHAKTGFISGVHSLAGVVTNKRGTDYVFVVMVNDYDAERTVDARDFVDRAALSIQQSNILP
jgi:D-alanyl-D-alanine carboxypeptidase/D-alanyl-D-alanine-endopeptidase (penicillin-binding protein 4)